MYTCSIQTWGSTTSSNADASRICSVVPVASKPQIDFNAGLVSILYSLVMKDATLPSFTIAKSLKSKLLILQPYVWSLTSSAVALFLFFVEADIPVHPTKFLDSQHEVDVSWSISAEKDRILARSNSLKLQQKITHGSSLLRAITLRVGLLASPTYDCMADRLKKKIHNSNNLHTQNTVEVKTSSVQYTYYKCKSATNCTNSFSVEPVLQGKPDRRRILENFQNPYTKINSIPSFRNNCQ